jgi:hypothetical protein
MADLAVHLSLDFVQVPLYGERCGTLPLIGFCALDVVNERLHCVNLPKQMLAHRRIRGTKLQSIQFALSDAAAQIFQLLVPFHQQIKRDDLNICTSYHWLAVAPPHIGTGMRHLRDTPWRWCISREKAMGKQSSAEKKRYGQEGGTHKHLPWFTFELIVFPQPE